MIELDKYLSDEDDIDFVKDLYDCVAGQNEIDLSYEEDFIFTFCPSGEVVFIYDDTPDNPKRFENLDDMLLNYLLDGKPFIEQIEKIDYA